MRYYTIQNGSLLIADSFNALARFYGGIQPLPEDYEEGKYIVIEHKEEIEVPEFDSITGEMIGSHIEIKVTYTLELNPNFEDEKKAKEKARIAEIALTRADVFEALILARGLTKQMLRSFIEQDETLNDIEKALYLNRFDDALEFYRKHPAIDFISAKLGISTDDMDKFFDTKDYTFLKPVVNPDPNTKNESPDSEGVVGYDVTHDDPYVTHGEDVVDGE